jgi:ParB/RepB/Spo0J family partition protein
MSEPKSSNDPAIIHVPQNIALLLIDPSPFQRRKHFDEAKLREIGESIKVHGQFDDAIVRPKAEGRFELIAGDRRRLGSGLVGLETLRCKVIAMTDDEAREAVIIQQVQHEEWTTTEEAEGYRDLLGLRDPDGKARWTEKTLGERINKSEAHIRELVSILETPEEMRQAVDAGTVSKRAAASVATVVDPKNRELCAQMVLHPTTQTTPLSAKATIALIQEKFQRRLQGAPFSTKDETLVPAAGSCENCELRTGRNPRLTALLQTPGTGSGSSSGISPDICTEPACYLKKCAAAEEQVKKKALERGCELMPDKEAAALFDDDGKLRDNVDFVDRLARPDPTLCHHYNEAKMPTWKNALQTMGQTEVKAWLAKNPVSGEHHELIKWADAVKSINDGCRELGDKPFFKAGEPAADEPAAAAEPDASRLAVIKDAASSTETLRPGDPIMLPTKKENPLWDAETARKASQEAREKERRDAARLKAVLEAMHAKIVVGLGLEPAVSDRIYSGLAEDMLTLVADEKIVDDLARFYGVQPETEETVRDLAEAFVSMDWPRRGAFLIMVIARTMGARHGISSSHLEEWCSFLNIDVPGDDEDTSTEAKLSRALHAIEGAGARWDALRKIGASDETLTAAIAFEFGIDSAGEGAGGWQAQGGTSPKLFGSQSSGEVLLEGEPLLYAVRELLNIGEPFEPCGRCGRAQFASLQDRFEHIGNCGEIEPVKHQASAEIEKIESERPSATHAHLQSIVRDVQLASGAEDTSIDAKLMRALHSTAGAVKRWQGLRHSGACDDALTLAIAAEFGIGTGSSSNGGWQVKGGTKPALHDAKGKKLLTGKALLGAVRGLLLIGKPLQPGDVIKGTCEGKPIKMVYLPLAAEAPKATADELELNVEVSVKGKSTETVPVKITNNVVKKERAPKASRPAAAPAPAPKAEKPAKKAAPAKKAEKPAKASKGKKK